MLELTKDFIQKLGMTISINKCATMSFNNIHASL